MVYIEFPHLLVAALHRQELLGGFAGTQESTGDEYFAKSKQLQGLLTVFPRKRIPSSESKTDPYQL